MIRTYARVCVSLIVSLLGLSLASQFPGSAPALAARPKVDIRAPRLRSRELSLASFEKLRGRITRAAADPVGRGLRRLGYRTEPAFIIVGAQKGGTWALRLYLTAHPLVIGPKTSQEIHFFDQDRLYRRGMGWYSRFFPLPHTVQGGKQTFECTTTYMYVPKAIERIHQHMPRVKLIVLLREPIKRAFSAWNMYRHFHASRNDIVRVWRRQLDPHVFEQIMSLLSRDPFPDFATMVREELRNIGSNGEVSQPGLIRRGYYDEQLARIYAIFSRDQVLVLESNRLRSRPREVLDETTEFLGLRRFEWPEHVLVPHHAMEYVSRIDSKVQAMLSEVFKPHNERLFELLGADLGWNGTS